MSKLLLSVLILLSCHSLQAQEKPWDGKSVDFTHGKLTVSPNRRFLIHADGTPFFYMGDTAWELFHRLNETEVERYLENRRAKGFTVIQAVILAELDGLNTPNRNGHTPLRNNNPETPSEDYFRWVDKVIRIAESKGLYLGLLPTWGDKVDPQWGKGPVVFTPQSATAYGKFLGQRYKNTPNIIWINGGDRSGGGDNYPVWDALGKAIKAEDPNHLMTYHPMGENSSSQWFHNCDWLDFNMCQTGHGQRSYDIYLRLVTGDYNRKPIKPCLDGEPRYEDHPVSWMPETYGWFDHADVRQAMYWNLFSGAFGHTYGCHPIWQFKSAKDEPVGYARHNWEEVLDLEGAHDLIHARRLLESFDFTSRRPDQSIIITHREFATDVAVATRGKDYAFVYLPNGHSVEVALDRIPGANRLSLQWYNPRTGEYTDIRTANATGTFQANPPASGRGNDWVLVMSASDSGQIAVNQLGFYPEASKEAAVMVDPGIKTFKIVDATTGREVYSGELNELLHSKNSSLSARRADFSAYTTPGNYRIVAGETNSAVFAIRDHILSDVAKASLKAFYYQRVSEPLDSRHAGRWARPAGHPDTEVHIHPSAASPQRPVGTLISSPGGWYDAGDYNKYIVNSGITTATLLSAYEDFPDYYRRLAVDIPETGNGIPDLLNEILCNLRWMLTMQDPNNGGVYHKCTNASFDGMVMPGVTKAPRYAVQKSTAAALDFTAVMAQASRVYAGYEKQLPGLADSCLHAARKAWEWALQHPGLTYNQDALNRQYEPAVSTGAYGDNRLDDEWFWAAAEMYAATSGADYKAKAKEYIDARLQVPSWGQVYMLGVYTLLRMKDTELATAYRKKVLEMADNFATSVHTNAFGVVMGHKPSDFVWGSNAVAANQGILLIQAYLLTKDAKYLNAALTNADYLLGKNATGYCFVTGFGSKRVMNPHHRPSVADGIDDPVPGLLAGGPNPGMQDGCEYPFTEPETAFTDHADSYASNEIAINWNAPAVYLFNALEALKGSAKLSQLRESTSHGCTGVSQLRESTLHACTEVSPLAKAFCTDAQRFRNLAKAFCTDAQGFRNSRKHFARMHKGFATSRKHPA